MKILVIGAGVLGSLFAARLKNIGEDVTLLARGKRLEEIRFHGVLLADSIGEHISITHLQATDSLGPDDVYDLIIVAVRKNQLDSVLPMLVKNQASPNILFMVNNAAGADSIAQVVGRSRVILGFPGAGGVRGRLIVRYTILSPLIQPTTLGELDGQTTPRLATIAAMFRRAGFPTVTSTNIDAWMKTHAALVSPIANAVYLAGGDNFRLGRTQDGLVLMVRAIRENFAALEKLGVPITPWKFRLVKWTPEPVLVMLMRLAMPTRWAETVITAHANAARDEMAVIATEVKQLADKAGVATPCATLLCAFIDAATPPLPQFSRQVKISWRGFWMMLLGLAGLGVACTWICSRKEKALDG